MDRAKAVRTNEMSRALEETRKWSSAWQARTGSNSWPTSSTTDPAEHAEPVALLTPNYEQLGKGAESRRRLQHGGRAATIAREQRAGRAGWKDRAQAIDAKLRATSPRLSRKERASAIIAELGLTLTFRTVYDSLNKL